jgi:transposase-like protein
VKLVGSDLSDIRYQAIMCRPEICLQVYNKNERNFGMTRAYKSYSESFKRQVVSEYEAGISVHGLQKKYDIRGSGTIAGWIKKYAREGFRHEFIRIQTKNEIQRIKTLEKKVEELEQALGKVMLEKMKLESIVEELAESYDVEIKKNEVLSSDALQTRSKTVNGK